MSSFKEIVIPCSLDGTQRRTWFHPLLLSSKVLPGLVEEPFIQTPAIALYLKPQDGIIHFSQWHIFMLTFVILSYYHCSLLNNQNATKLKIQNWENRCNMWNILMNSLPFSLPLLVRMYLQFCIITIKLYI